MTFSRWGSKRNHTRRKAILPAPVFRLRRVGRLFNSSRMTATSKGIGAALARKEDDRFLRGHGEYVGDVQLDGMLEVAFVRSPVAHGRLRTVAKPAGAEDRIFTAADLSDVRPIK